MSSGSDDTSSTVYTSIGNLFSSDVTPNAPSSDYTGSTYTAPSFDMASTVMDTVSLGDIDYLSAEDVLGEDYTEYLDSDLQAILGSSKKTAASSIASSTNDLYQSLLDRGYTSTQASQLANQWSVNQGATSDLEAEAQLRTAQVAKRASDYENAQAYAQSLNSLNQEANLAEYQGNLTTAQTNAEMASEEASTEYAAEQDWAMALEQLAIYQELAATQAAGLNGIYDYDSAQNVWDAIANIGTDSSSSSTDTSTSTGTTDTSTTSSGTTTGTTTDSTTTATTNPFGNIKDLSYSANGYTDYNTKAAASVNLNDIRSGTATANPNTATMNSYMGTDTYTANDLYSKLTEDYGEDQAQTYFKSLTGRGIYGW